MTEAEWPKCQGEKPDMMAKRREYDLSVSDWFWDLIERAKQDPGRMEKLLENLSQEQLQRFHEDFDVAARELIPTRELPDRGLDQEGVWVASSWIVAQGKQHYRAVWDNPELLPNPDSLGRYLLFQLLAAAIHERKFGEWLY